MNIKQLKEKIADLPDDMQVLVPSEPLEGFTGMFFSPCMEESGPIEMAGDEHTTDEELDQYENKVIDLVTEKSFTLVPCDFYEEKDHKHELN